MLRLQFRRVSRLVRSVPSLGVMMGLLILHSSSQRISDQSNVYDVMKKIDQCTGTIVLLLSKALYENLVTPPSWLVAFAIRLFLMLHVVSPSHVPQEEEFADTGYQITQTDPSARPVATASGLGALTAEDFNRKLGAIKDDTRYGSIIHSRVEVCCRSCPLFTEAI